MRLWDITDEVLPGIRITERPHKQERFKGFVSSAVTVFLSVGLVVGSSGAFQISAQDYASQPAAKVQVSVARPLPGAVKSQLPKHATSSTDTQFGQSTVKLSRSFDAFFRPAPEEEEYEDDYSFS